MVSEQAVRGFVAKWAGDSKGREAQDSQSFWIDLLTSVLGAVQATSVIEFEKPVELSHKSRIDCYIRETGTIIEQKGRAIDLDAPALQSDGAQITPFGQAARYASALLNKNGIVRWIVTCNFTQIRIYDVASQRKSLQNGQFIEGSPTAVVFVKDLLDPKEQEKLAFLLDPTAEKIRVEEKISLAAGKLVGELYDALACEYHNGKERYVSEDDFKTNATIAQKDALNILCVRIVFCLYCEDAGFFQTHTCFEDYLAKMADPTYAGQHLNDLWQMLDTPEADRDPYKQDRFKDFPYVNGGLFHEVKIGEIPNFTKHIVEVINKCAAFDWEAISPAIFGAVFESTLDKDQRHENGMHYTSIRNIERATLPLFLRKLRDELDAILKSSDSTNKKRSALFMYQDKISKLTFLDPACGSGNFLTATYKSLRELENRALEYLVDTGNGDNRNIAIKVKLSQFYGIEVNNFAVRIAKTALWIAESQTLKETTKMTGIDADFLPLRENANIVEEDALKLDWLAVCGGRAPSYIMGNPPFSGARVMTAAQKEQLIKIFGSDWKGAGNLDYVCAWHKKAADLMKGNVTRAALVSTNSIVQGDSVAILWEPLIQKAGVHIDFAHRTFVWYNESKQGMAHVYCVIIGFSCAPNSDKRIIYTHKVIRDDKGNIQHDKDGNACETHESLSCDNINAYLLPAPNYFVKSRNKPLCKVGEMVFGSMPNDGGYLCKYNDEKKDAIIKKYPEAKELFRRFMGADEFLNGKSRWCLWLVGVEPCVTRRIKPVLEAINAVQNVRKGSHRASTVQLADKSALFGEIRQPTSGNYLLIPSVSSEKRDYIPIGFMPHETIASNATLILPNATLYDFGILTSSTHMAWMRTVGGRLKSDYRYSINIVYNNFPWPTEPSQKDKDKIEHLAQSVLDARAKSPNSSFADLYNTATMPYDLRRAHAALDAAVLALYKIPADASEDEIVARLMAKYQQLAGMEFDA